VPGERIAEILAMLQERDLVMEAGGDETPVYLLLHDPGSLTVHALLNTLRRPDDEQAIMEQRLKVATSVNSLFERVDGSVAEALQGASLRDLVASKREAAE
jgi:DNA-binding IscR family transcriptional regulator